ncbi:MAG: biotin--[acetyl-CoA-carboxylase] ligase, partial [Deltaproteobacteria bacterium RIFCSPLOWO2_01_FULL_38_9]
MLFSKCHSFKKVTSTNDIAYELAKKGAKEGEYVIAETQTKGRGRMQRKWVSKKGNLYVSLILRPSIVTRNVSHLTFVAALAVASALEKHLNISPQLKWPNDVLVDRKKISGILTEMESEGDKVDFMVVGMGINVNQDKFPKSLPNAISLYQVLGKNIEPGQLLEDLLA